MSTTVTLAGNVTISVAALTLVLNWEAQGITFAIDSDGEMTVVSPTFLSTSEFKEFRTHKQEIRRLIAYRGDDYA